MKTGLFFSSRRRHTRWPRDWSSDVCSSDLKSAVGLEWIAELRHQFPELPIVGIGGINRDNASSVIEAGADGEIGRASCRERVKSRECGGAGKKKKGEYAKNE